MSIIHSALKKVQAKQAPAHQLTTVSASTNVQTTRHTVISPLRLIVLGISVLLFIVIWRLTEPGPRAAKITHRDVPVIATPVITTVETTPSAPQKSEPVDPWAALHIEGTMDMGNGKVVVLINGNIYEEGQTLFDTTIMQITPESLTIKDRDTLRVIPLK